MPKLFLIYLLIILSSCSSIERNRIAPGYSEAYSAVKNVLFGYDPMLISNDTISSIPYASLILKIGKGPEGLLILQSKENHNESWVSSDGALFVINRGKITKTAGIENNLKRLLYSDESITQNLDNNKNTYLAYYSYDSPPLIDLRVEAKLINKGKERTKLRFGERELNLIEEHITNQQIGWRAVNKYWIDDQNYVWKSEQSISPRLPTIYYEITKKPSE